MKPLQRTLIATALVLAGVVLLLIDPTLLSALPSAQSVDPVLVGAGDIANCGTTQDSDTADLLDSIAGTVYTLGDNAYVEGTLQQFNDCYEPTWGRHRARTRPVPGNHEYLTS